MNYKERMDLIKELKGLFIATSPEGSIKITKGEGRSHRQVKSDICGWLKDNNWNFWTESNLTNGFKGRPDIIAIHPSGQAVIIEVVNSERELSLLEKQAKYPDQFYFMVIDVTKFNYDTFCI